MNMNFSWLPLNNNIEIYDIIPPITAFMNIIQGYSKLRSVSKSNIKDQNLKISTYRFAPLLCKKI